MQKKYKLILSAEQSFARAVAIGVRVKRPLTAWHFLIPGIFIFDYLKTSSEINEYSKVFLFPRRLALEAAQEISKGEDRQDRLAWVEEETKEWLSSLNLYSWGLHQRQTEEMNLLIEHYARLLNAEGNSYHSLVRNAYATRGNYQAHLSQLASVEKELDQAITEIRGETKDLWKRLLAERTQVEELREKEVNKIFAEAR